MRNGKTFPGKEQFESKSEQAVSPKDHLACKLDSRQEREYALAPVLPQKAIVLTVSRQRPK